MKLEFMRVREGRPTFLCSIDAQALLDATDGMHNHGIGAVDGSLTHTKRSLCRELSAQVWL
jgi:hypothetical protein